jgi:hypothetical protein
MPRLPKHNDDALIEALVRYVNVDLANDEQRIQKQAMTGPPDPPLNVVNGQAKYLFLHLMNDAKFRAAVDRPNDPRSFAWALKRVYKPLRDRGVNLTLWGNGYLTLESA